MTTPEKTLLLLLLSRFSRVQLCVTPWTAAHQAPLSMGFSRQECWSELPFPSLGYLPNPGIKLASPALPALAGRFFTAEPPGKTTFVLTAAVISIIIIIITFQVKLGHREVNELVQDLMASGGRV